MPSTPSSLTALSSLAFTPNHSPLITNTIKTPLHHCFTATPVREVTPIPRIGPIAPHPFRRGGTSYRLSAITLSPDENNASNVHSSHTPDEPEAVKAWPGPQPWAPHHAFDKSNLYTSTPGNPAHPGALGSPNNAFNTMSLSANEPFKQTAHRGQEEKVPFKFISADKMRELKTRYETQASTLDTIKEKFLFHDAFEKDKALQLFLMDSQGLSLTLATEIAAAHGRGHFILPPNSNLNADILGKLIPFMQNHPDGVIVVPSINNLNPAILPPEFMAARGVPMNPSSVYQFAKMAQDGLSLNPQAPPIVSKNKFLFVIANHNINNPNKVFGFHNKNVDTSTLNADIFMAYMGIASQSYQTEHNSILFLENRGLTKEAYTPLIESFIPDEMTPDDRKEVIDYVQSHVNEHTDYRTFKHLTADAIAKILSERTD